MQTNIDEQIWRSVRNLNIDQTEFDITPNNSKRINFFYNAI